MKLSQIFKRNVSLSIQIAIIWIVSLLLYSAIGINGYSIGEWPKTIGEANSIGLSLGKAQSIRSDDFVAVIPTVIAQIAHKPQFPIVNTLIGNGQNMLVYSEAPVNHFLTFFRPHTWGYFVSIDFGLSWSWYWRMGGVYLACLLLAIQIFKRLNLWTLIVPIIFLFSPFVQFWSGNSGTMILWAVVGAISLSKLFISTSKTSLALHSFLLGYSGVAEALLLYPAFAVPLAYSSILISACLIIDNFNYSKFKCHFSWRSISLLSSLMVIAGALSIFYFEARESILTMSNTYYPGLRFSTGGTFTPELMFAAWTFDRTGGIFSRLGGNICEGAYFYFFVPFLILPMLSLVNKMEFKVKVMFGLTMLTYSILLIWVMWGFPKEIARVTGLMLSPGRRSVIALGLLDFFIVLLAGKAIIQIKFENINVKRFTLLLLFSAILGLTFMSQIDGEKINYFKYSTWFPTIIVLSSVLLLYFRKTVLAFLLIIFAILRTTSSFNPIEIQSAKFLTDNSLAKLILRSDAKIPGGRWIALESIVEGNLFRMLGVSSLGGVHFVPQIEYWKKIAAKESDKNVYNRFAHVLFSLTPTQSATEFEFELLSPDSFTVRINPTKENLRKLGVTNILASCKKSGTIFSSIGWLSLGNFNDYCVWIDDDLLQKSSLPKITK